MMMQNLILTSIQKEELKSWIQETINDAIDLNSKHDDDLLSKDETSKMLGVSKVTLTEWMKQGKIPFSRVGGRVYFKKSLIINSLKDIKIRAKNKA